MGAKTAIVSLFSSLRKGDIFPKVSELKENRQDELEAHASDGGPRAEILNSNV